MNRTVKITAVVLLALVFLNGCKVRRAVEKSPLIPLSENALLDLVAQKSFTYETLSGKLAVTARTPAQNGSFKVNLRMGKDSVIWLSLTPALGIEAMRIMIEPDSLMFINKMKNLYFAGSYNAIDSLVLYSTRFEFMENLLVGNPVEIDPSEKYTSLVDDLYYVLQTKVKRKLKKAVDVQLKPNKSDSIYGDIIKDKKYQKAKEKLDEEDLIVKRYYIRASDFRVARVNIDDLYYKRFVQITYGDFQEFEGMIIPLAIDIDVNTPGDNSHIEMRYSRIKLNEPQSYPFKIPSDYKPIH